MNIKNVVIVGILTALTVGIASAKSYNFVLGATSTAGSHELKADQRYSVEFNGSEAVIKGERYGKAVTIPAKAEQNQAKYGVTLVETLDSPNGSGPRVIKAIQLGGSNTRLVLAQ